MTANVTTANVNYLSLVNAARELARHGLRTRNIRTRVEEIGQLNLLKSELIKEAEEVVKEATHNVEAATYQLAKKNLDANLGDPDFKDRVKELEENLANAKTNLADAEKELAAMKDGSNEDVKHLNKDIEACNEAISKWEKGENKVQLENVDKLAREIIETAINEKAKSLSNLLG